MSGPTPAITGIHHFSPTVTDVEASAAWYQRVFGMERVPVTFPHYGNEDTGYAVLLTDAHSGLAIGLHHHADNKGEPFDETRTGLDHLALNVASSAELESWVRHLDALEVDHSGVTVTSRSSTPSSCSATPTTSSSSSSP